MCCKPGSTSGIFAAAMAYLEQEKAEEAMQILEEAS